MPSGGKRCGAGMKPGTKKKKLIPKELKMITLGHRLPKWLFDKLKKEHGNRSEYIRQLILKDNPDWKPPE
jgi:hypothetical protein